MGGLPPIHPLRGPLKRAGFDPAGTGQQLSPGVPPPRRHTSAKFRPFQLRYIQGTEHRSLINSVHAT